MEPKHCNCLILHADLFVTSMDAALDFYCDKLGFSIVDDSLVLGPLIQSISFGTYNAARLVLLRSSPVGAMIELQEFQTDSALTDRGPNFSCGGGLVSVLVANLEAHIMRAISKGLHPSSEVFTVTLPRQGTCRLVFYKDSDGNRLEFLQVQQHSARQGTEARDLLLTSTLRKQ